MTFDLGFPARLWDQVCGPVPYYAWAVLCASTHRCESSFLVPLLELVAWRSAVPPDGFGKLEEGVTVGDRLWLGEAPPLGVLTTSSTPPYRYRLIER